MPSRQGAVRSTVGSARRKVSDQLSEKGERSAVGSHLTKEPEALTQERAHFRFLPNVPTFLPAVRADPGPAAQAGPTLRPVGGPPPIARRHPLVVPEIFG